MDPYAAGIAKGRPVCRKRDVIAEVAAVHATRREGRGLQLIAPYTRALPRYSIQELVVTDEAEASPGSVVNAVAYIGFAEIVQGGVVMVGDSVSVDDQPIGVVAGFDEAHAPNHYNIVVRAEQRRSGFELGVEVGARIVISSNGVDEGTALARREISASLGRKR